MTAPPHTARQQAPMADVYRAAMAHVPSCVSVVTTHTPAGPVGVTVSALLSLSLSPPALVVSLTSSGQTLPWIRRSGAFGVNVLGWEQRHLVEQFATGPPQQRFEGVPHTFHLGQPLIVSAPVRIVCTLEATREEWDHTLLTGRVAWCSHHPESAGLLLHGRGRHPVPHHAAG
ncbi:MULTISPECIES: flavin reductase family protein [Streptomyces]|uniref:flavin reductase family protein n=1 Tax=Streptomyces TaxID=1883 RepID=UPI0006919AA3|nr:MULTISPECIES: flavin reductase family protein [Streptomyces]MCL7490469.1 flavin reductase family protein [Streptomyces sp. MCA2]WSV46091.1 flavin reductase family protein [Streptomyces decoyicus]